MIKKRILPIASAVAFALMVAVNVLAQTTGVTTAMVSNSLPTLLTPSGITFSVWIIIYGLLLIYTVSMLMNGVDKTGGLYLITCMLNIFWIIAWRYKLIFIAMVVIFVLWMALYLINMKLKDDNSLAKITFAIYYAWITIASIVSLFAYVTYAGGGVYDTTIIRISAVLSLVVLAILIYFNRNNMPYLLVMIWSLVGIISKNVSSFNGRYKEIILTSVILTTISLTMIFIYLVNRQKGWIEE